MADILTDEQVREIEERCNKATPGPWFIDEGVNPPDVQIILENLNYAVCETFNCNIDQLNDADPVFIANARTDIPNLIATLQHVQAKHNSLIKIQRETQAEIMQLMEINARLREALEWIRENVMWGNPDKACADACIKADEALATEGGNV